MSGETEKSVSGWTVDTLLAHRAELDRREEKYDAMRDRWLAERDRRYAEVALEREKALKIKETADETARILVAANQAYRDEKANDLRSQIEGERGNYITRPEIKPLTDYVAAQSGPRAITPQAIYGLVAAIGVIAALWFSSQKPTVVPVVTAPTVTVTAP